MVLHFVALPSMMTCTFSRYHRGDLPFFFRAAIAVDLRSLVMPPLVIYTYTRYCRGDLHCFALPPWSFTLSRAAVMVTFTSSHCYRVPSLLIYALSCCHRR